MKKIIFFSVALSCCGVLCASEAERTFAAARHIRAGEEIKAEALRDVAAVPGAVSLAPGEFAGMEAVRPIRAGETLTRLMLRPVRMVRPGEKIRVKTILGRVKVSSWFTALQGGAKGETINARNQASGRVCAVTVAGSGEGFLEEAGK
jgi:flagella basal body P-ring formation protein FlgA